MADREKVIKALSERIEEAKVRKQDYIKILPLDVRIIIDLLNEQNPRKGQWKHVNKKPDREKVVKELHDLRRYLEDKEWSDNRVDRQAAKVHWQTVTDAIAMLKEQDELINELLELGYPHNFQHEAPWVVDYLYKLTEIIKKAFKIKEGR